MTRAGRVALAALVIGLAAARGGLVAAAQDEGVIDGPTISLDRSTMQPGERVLVTLEGFRGSAVTMSVCGNQARRGSADCNMTASEGLGLDRDGSPTLTELPVAAPPVSCPCLIRASTTKFDEVAITPIELIGHPVGPVVGAEAREPLVVSVSARRSPRGSVDALRALLGGPTTYAVTVSVSNRSTETLERVAVTGSAMRGGDDVATLDLPDPGPIQPGQTWRRVVRTTIPAPVLGTFRWQVTASGAGSGAHAEAPTSDLPVALIVLALVFGVDIAAIAWRRIRRRSEPVTVTEAASVVDLRSADPSHRGPDLRDQPTTPVDDEMTRIDSSREVSPR